MSSNNNSKYGPKHGFFHGRIRAFNPSIEQIRQLIGKDDINWDLRYTGETNEGERKVNMDIWIENVDKAGDFYRMKFMIADKPRDSKNSPGKFQWVNSQGQTAWGFKEADLRAYSWFGQKGIRKAYTGEENLVDLLSVWFTQGAKPKDDLRIEPTIEMLFDGDFSELNSFVPQMNGAANDPDYGKLTFLATVNVHNGKGYQNLWRKAAPGWWLKPLLNGDREKSIGRYVEEITGQFGCKDVYTLGKLTSDPPQQGQQAPQQSRQPQQQQQQGWQAPNQKGDDQLPF